MGVAFRSPARANVGALDGAEGDDDRILVERAQRDPRDFAPLYDRYVGRVYGYCDHRLGEVEAAEDATSLIFARALAALPRFTAEGATFRAGLFTIAHHTIVDSCAPVARSSR